MSDKEHYEKYEKLAQTIGVNHLIKVLHKLNSYKERLQRLYCEDENLNNINLSWWDSHHSVITMLAHKSGIKMWSLCETVCVLKHVAIHHILNIDKPN